MKGWLLNEIVVHCEKDHKDYFFTCNKWLSSVYIIIQFNGFIFLKIIETIV